MELREYFTYQVWNKNTSQFELFDQDGKLIGRKPFPYEGVPKRKF